MTRFDIDPFSARSAADRVVSAGRTIQEVAGKVDAALDALAGTTPDMSAIEAALSRFAQSRTGEVLRVGERMSTVGRSGRRAVDVMEQADSDVSSALRDASDGFAEGL